MAMIDHSEANRIFTDFGTVGTIPTPLGELIGTPTGQDTGVRYRYTLGLDGQQVHITGMVMGQQAAGEGILYLDSKEAGHLKVPYIGGDGTAGEDEEEDDDPIQAGNIGQATLEAYL